MLYISRLDPHPLDFGSPLRFALPVWPSGKTLLPAHCLEGSHSNSQSGGGFLRSIFNNTEDSKQGFESRSYQMQASTCIAGVIRIIREPRSLQFSNDVEGPLLNTIYAWEELLCEKHFDVVVYLDGHIVVAIILNPSEAYLAGISSDGWYCR